MSVTLLTSDAQRFSVPVDAARLSTMLRGLMEDVDVGGEVIPLPSVSGRTLAKVLEWCRFHAPREPSPTAADDPVAFDEAWADVDQDELFHLIIAANYLDITPMLDLLCTKVAGMITGKTPEEIRKTFGIENDFTPAEEEDVRRENAWALE